MISNNVTKQVSITENVKYIDIRDSNIDDWVEAILNVKAPDKDKAFATINESRFNIEKATQALLDIYNSQVDYN